MTLSIHITPEVEGELTRRATARGMDLSSFVSMVLEEAAKPRPQIAQTIEEFEQSLDRIAQFSDEIPALPDEAFSRESFYRDHD